MQLVLSLFHGIDGLGRGFSNNGFCVVQGGDLITAHDVRDFHAPPNRFDGIIGGPPCQDFSALNRSPSNYSSDMLNEFSRVVQTARPTWFLMENVARVPTLKIDGYNIQRFNLDYGWISPYSRLRAFQWGHREGVKLNPMTGKKANIEATAVHFNCEHSFDRIREIQGFPACMKLTDLTPRAKRQALVNAVPIPLANYLAQLVNEALNGKAKPLAKDAPRRRCACGCGRVVSGRAKYSGGACRTRAYRSRPQ